MTLGRQVVASKVPAALLLFGVALGVYLSNGRFLESTDTYGNELLPIAIIVDHSLTFDAFYRPPDPTGGYPTGDDAVAPGPVAAGGDYRLLPWSTSDSLPWWFRRRGDHVVSLYPIAPGVLNTLVFVAAAVLSQPIGERVVPLTHVTTSTVAALSVACMYAALVQVCAQQRTAVFLSLAFAFGTAVWSLNSRSLYQHGPAVLFVTAGLAALLTQRRRWIALSGLMLSLAVVTRPTTVVLAGGLVLFVLRQQRRAFIPFLALASVPAVLLAWYSWVYWGSLLALGQGQGLSGFTAPEPLTAAVGLLVSPNRGLLVFSPMLIFSIVFGVYLLRCRLGPVVLRYLVWSSLAEYGLYTVWSDWAGGHTYGYRFLIDVVPGLMLVLGVGWERFAAPQAVVRALFSGALAASIYVHGLGATVSPCGFDTVPDNIDYHHERLWDIRDGEIARCTRQEVSAWHTALARLQPGSSAYALDCAAAYACSYSVLAAVPTAPSQSLTSPS